MSPLPLAQLPLTTSQHIPAVCKSHPLINPTLIAFRETCNKQKISSTLGPMTPLAHNPEFTPGTHPSFLTVGWPHPNIRAEHFFSEGRLLTQDELATKMNKTSFPFWTYVQIRHFFSRPKPQPDWARRTTAFESLCLSEEPQKHLISLTYNMLFSNQNSNLVWHNKKWEQELNITLTEKEWENIYTHIHKGTINVQIQENAFKVLSRWYRTPLTLHHFNPALTQHCWRCQTDIGSLLHIWWTCPKIQLFWKEVHRIITQVTTYTLDYTPEQFLLHHSTIPTRSYLCSLAMHMVNAAKMCIPCKWRSPDPPTIADWYKRIQKTAEMEELIHKTKDTPTKFTHTWACWLHFLTTDDYKKIIP